MDFDPQLIEKLQVAKSILFFTGAGISAESGIPTFRGKDGIWNKLKPEELANFDAFLRNPDLVWEWYRHRRHIIEESGPNGGHYAMAEFEKYYDEVNVVTQNVDNLHRRAGSTNIYELHGNIERNFCVNCGKRYDYEKFTMDKHVPKCDCGGLIRPDVVWFGEMLPYETFEISEQKARECDICFVVGTSAVVYPAAQIPILAMHSGAFIVEVNTDYTEISRAVDLTLTGKSGEILPEIVKEIEKFKA